MCRLVPADKASPTDAAAVPTEASRRPVPADGGPPADGRAEEDGRDKKVDTRRRPLATLMWGSRPRPPAAPPRTLPSFPSMRTLIRLLVVLGLVAGVIGFLVNRSGREATPHPCEPGTEGCPAAPAEGSGTTTDSAMYDGYEALAEPEWLRVDSLEGSLVCPGSGYLCAGFEDRGSWRVVRWDEDTPLIRIRVPRPPVEDAALARSLQAAAVRGLRTWHGHPFPLRIDLSDRDGPYDVTVRWTLVPGGRELGHARTRWRRSGEEATIRVDDFALAVRNPTDPRRALSPEQVELTAAHEMGHALGLPHSDREDDVMYPSNTATRLTSRDFRTMEALYRLDNGAAVVKP